MMKRHHWFVVTAEGERLQAWAGPVEKVSEVEAVVAGGYVTIYAEGREVAGAPVPDGTDLDALRLYRYDQDDLLDTPTVRKVRLE